MNITIVGLGSVGTAVGLALKAAPHVTVTGHDPDPERTKAARQRGAIDRQHWNLPAACDGADLVLLDLPLEEAHRTMSVLAAELAGPVVVVDNAALQRPVLAWAEELSTDAVQFLGGHLLAAQATPTAEPSAQPLSGALFYVVAPPRTAEWALDRAGALAALLGAQIVYVDAAEHDGLIAATEQLPVAAVLALLAALRDTPGLQDRQRAVGPALNPLLALLATAQASVDELAGNADNLLRWLDLYLAQLGQLRQALAQKQPEELAQMLGKALETLPPADTGAEAEPEINPWRRMFLGGWGQGKPRPR